MSPNEAQAEAWNGGESAHYVAHADRYDRQLAPFTKALMEHAEIEGNESVLDVGCGCGDAALRAARSARTVLGVDISDPLVGVARNRARARAAHNVRFMVADAQTDAIGEDGFDVLISQFGLMFFDDPAGAFVNLRRALSPRGRVAFTCWQGLDDNEWLTVVSTAVARHVEVPELGGLARGPGMFAFKDPDETIALLTAAGFAHAVAEPVTTTILLAGGGPPEESVEFLLGMGMVRGLLDHLEEDSLVAAAEEIRAAVAEKHEPSVGTHLGAAGWLVSART